jgi:hypothetical protein
MKYYHYTSSANWKQIQEEGLVPGLMMKEELLKYFPGGAMGIWLWPERLEGRAHLGSIIYQMAYKNTSSVVLLEVDYDGPTLMYGDKFVQMYHNGTIQNFEYHNLVPSQIATERIPPEQIKLINEYDFNDYIKEKDSKC